MRCKALATGGNRRNNYHRGFEFQKNIAIKSERKDINEGIMEKAEDAKSLT